MSKLTCYRCGYCGQPTDSEGFALSIDDINEMSVDWIPAEKVHGKCCVESENRQRQRATKEMAMDAQDLSLEGTCIKQPEQV